MLRQEDFVLDGILSSEGSTIREAGHNHFKLTLARVPQPAMPTASIPNHLQKHYPARQEGWANWLRFEINQNARGNSLRLSVDFEAPKECGMFCGPKEGGVPYPFTSFEPCWSYNGKEWNYVSWEEGVIPGRSGTLVFPVFEKNRVLVCTQLPMTIDDAEGLVKAWSLHPHVKVHHLGKSLGGRNLYRVTITDPNSDIEMSGRWVHHVANQHPGEGIAQWYIAGMVKWFLSDEAMTARARTIAHFTLLMNPDGVANGWCRVNAQGIDMNRSFRVEGAHSELQPHEAFIFQRDLETILYSDCPVTTSWSMHSSRSPCLSPMLVGRGPELRGILGPDELFASLLKKHDTNNLINPYHEHHRAPTPECFWDGGPHHAWGITTFLVEGGGSKLDNHQSIEAGRILMKALTEYYAGERQPAEQTGQKNRSYQ